MARVIHTTKQGCIIEFDKGKFDDWCVYVTGDNVPRHAPTDVQYFTMLDTLGKIHGHQQIYNDFVVFYQMTNSTINAHILQTIQQLSSKYGNDSHEIEKWFTVIYAGMIAEENKQYTILKKRIKRLGMYQVLIERKDPRIAAYFSKGKRWKELDSLMRTKGF